MPDTDEPRSAPIGLLVGGRHVICMDCYHSSGYKSFLYARMYSTMEPQASYLYHENIGQYRQTCHHCLKVLHEAATPAWPELFTSPAWVGRTPTSKPRARTNPPEHRLLIHAYYHLNYDQFCERIGATPYRGNDQTPDFWSWSKWEAFRRAAQALQELEQLMDLITRPELEDARNAPQPPR